MIPYEEIETLFLDVGNTLVSIDFPWIVRELEARGVCCTPEALRRAEAAARPGISAMLADAGGEGRVDFSLEIYLAGILERLAAGGTSLGAGLERLAGELAPVLRGPGGSAGLWTWVLPGVHEALERFRALGLELVVVSNSDGTVEQTLREQRLAPHFHAILDSHHVGFEKPDRRIFDHALERAGGDPRRTLHVGDLYSADVVGARRAGIHALLLDPFGDWGPLDCPTLPDLAALAEKLAAAR